MLEVNSKVLINLPETACGILHARELKKYNRKIATVTEAGDKVCRLSIDGGKYEWPYHVLAVPVARI